MKITRKKDKVTRYCIDGKVVTYNALNEFCKKFLSEEGLHAMWRKVISSGECTLELDINCDENKLLEQINAELQFERAKNPPYLTKKKNVLYYK